MKIHMDGHIEETTLESYSLGTLDDSAAAQVEQHLLICDDCREKIEEADVYVAAMQSAAAKLPPEPKESRWTIRFFMPVFAACALLLIGIVAARFVARPGGGSPVTVALFAMRGADASAHAPSGRPLLLQPDLAGLPSASTYQLDIVDSAGTPVWHGSFKSAGPATTIAPALHAGDFFVRLSTPSGQLLR